MPPDRPIGGEVIKTLIRNGTIPDFSEFQMVRRDLIIEGGKIAECLRDTETLSEENYDLVIDAGGLIVSPGFIDGHSHSDLAVFSPPEKHPKIRQGVTAEIVGNCGLSVVPVKPASREEWKERYLSIWGFADVPWEWTNTASYLDTTNRKGSNRVETLLGYSTLRFHLTGMDAGSYDDDMLRRMEALIDSELEQGARGISIGIGYPPNIYAEPAEYLLLTRMLKKHNRVLAVHMRDEGDRVIESFEEIMGYNEEAGCKIQISHLKTYGEKNWHLNERLLELVDQYGEQFDLTFDSYPYTAGSTTLTSLLPPNLLDQPRTKLFEGLKNKTTRDYISQSIKEGLNNWENYGRLVGFANIFPTGLQSPKYGPLEGKSLVEIAEDIHQGAVDTICDIITEEDGHASMCMFAMNEKNVQAMYQHPRHMAGSDGLFSSKPHPRTYGTFPRIIGKFCRQDQIFDLPTALYKMTKFPARRFDLPGRGEIKEGYAADLVIFDFNTIIDRATYFNPKVFSDGIKYILRDGKIIWQDDR